MIYDGGRLLNGKSRKCRARGFEYVPLPMAIVIYVRETVSPSNQFALSIWEIYSETHNHWQLQQERDRMNFSEQVKKTLTGILAIISVLTFAFPDDE